MPLKIILAALFIIMLFHASNGRAEPIERPSELYTPALVREACKIVKQTWDDPKPDPGDDSLFSKVKTICLSMIMELVDGNKTQTKEDLKFCAPAGTNFGAYTKTLVEYLEKNPETLKGPTLVVTRAALIKKYPCDKK